MSLAFSPVDLLVVLVVLGSMGFAIWRGFVSETLGIVAWAAAAFAALYLGPWAGRLAQSLISTLWLAIVTGYALVFILVFIPIQFASYRFSEGVKRSPVGPLDRILGGTFGFVRGLAILGIAYLVFDAFVPIRDHPRWLTEARSLPLIQSSAEVILTLIPERDRHETVPPPPPPPLKPAAETPRPHPAEIAKPKPGKKKHGKKGYGAKDRQALDRLFEATGGKQ
jgi:membrane protein required for colicin V production